MSRPWSADDPSRRDPEPTLASDPARPAGLPAPLAPLPSAPAASAIWTSLPPPAILALFLPPAHRVWRKTLANAAPPPPPPSRPQAHVLPARPRVNRLYTSRAPDSSVAMSPTPFPRPPCALQRNDPHSPRAKP